MSSASHNKDLEQYLQRLVQQARIPHALLFAGPAHSPVEACARKFASQIVGQSESQPHPDLHAYFPEGKLGQHSIDTMRALISEVYLPPYQAPYKVFLIFQAERMAATSANALLKTFEEPPPKSLILLVSHFPEKLLLTIRSRCQALLFQGETPAERISHPLLIEILSNLPASSYPRLLSQVEELATSLEKETTTPADEEAELTALQKQAREKEQEGQSAIALLRATEALFEQLLGWYRDLHLLHLNGPIQELFHPSHEPSLRESLERGRLPSLDQLHKIIVQTRLSLERSAPLKNSLESLFLALKRIA